MAETAQSRAPARPTARPAVWLVATEPERETALRVLAGELAETRAAPATQVLRLADMPPPERLPPLALLVLSGDVIPVALTESAVARGTGLFWLEAGATPRLDRRSLMPGRLRTCLARMSEIHARDAAAAAELTRLVRGAVPVHAGGRLARHPPAAPSNAAELEALRTAVAGRPVWFAYSVPAAEFDHVLAAQVTALRHAHRLVLIAAPRDPRDGPDLAARGAALGLSVARRMVADEPDPATQVYVADAEDAPGLFLRLAPVTYLGGSLTPGEQTPPAMPAAALGSALILGPETREADAGALVAAGGARRLARSGDLGQALAALVAPDAGAAMALRAWDLATAGAENTAQAARAIADWLALNARGAD